MRAFSKVLYIEDVHLGTSGFLLPGGGGLEDLGGVEGGSVLLLSTEYKVEGSLKN